MSEFKRFSIEDIWIEKINLVRATLNEAQDIKDNIIEAACEFEKIIVDLSDCEYIDSTFFGALVYCYKKILGRGGEIKLVMNDTFMTRTFIFRDIERVFNVYNKLNQAIDAYKEFEEVDFCVNNGLIKTKKSASIMTKMIN